MITITTYQWVPPFGLEFAGMRRSERVDHMPAFGRGNEGHGAIGAQFGGEVSGAPRPAARFIAALRLDQEKAFAARTAIRGESAALATIHHKSQSRQVGPGADFVSLAAHQKLVVGAERLVDRGGGEHAVAEELGVVAHAQRACGGSVGEPGPLRRGVERAHPVRGEERGVRRFARPRGKLGGNPARARARAV